MKLQYISDIHLEHYKLEDIDKVIPKKEADILILAGDIGYPEQIQYKMYIEKVSKIWDKVFIVAGNHEYYQTTKKIKTKEEIDNIIEFIVEDYVNVYYLNNSKIEITFNKEEYVIIGCTLFSDIEPTDYSYQININDFKYIYKKRETFKSYTYNYSKINLLDYKKYYNESKKFLEDTLDYYKNTNYNVIVVTHYAPSFDCIEDKYKSSKLNKAYYSNLEYLINNLYCWIHGHTHSQREVIINGIKVLNNSIGYNDEIEHPIRLERTYDKKIKSSFI
jgi:predicted phosphodiesterase